MTSDGDSLVVDEAAQRDYQAKAEEIFTFFLGHEGYLALLAANGLGYGPVSLGE